MVFETVATMAIGTFAVIGSVIGGVLVIQFANNASRNMSLTNANSAEEISKVSNQ